MSGLAQIMNNMDFQIQGSDLNSNKNTDRFSLKEERPGAPGNRTPLNYGRTT